MLEILHTTDQSKHHVKNEIILLKKVHCKFFSFYVLFA